MKPTLKHIYTGLFFLGIFFIPFNSYEGIAVLGEYSREGAVVFFLAALTVYGIDVSLKDKTTFPKNNLFTQFLLIFIGWLLLSVLLNGTTVSQNYMKHTSGVSRFVRQLLSLSIALSIWWLSYVIFKKQSVTVIFLRIRNVFLYAFVFVFGYSLLEIAALYGNSQAAVEAMAVFNYVPFVEVGLDFTYKRISSVALEPPFLAIFLITIAGWMFSYIITSKGFKKYLPTIAIFIITFFSGSRTALIVVFFQFLVFVGLVFTLNKKYRSILQKMAVTLGVLMIVLLAFNGKAVSEAVDSKVASLNFKENLQKSISNRSRFGIQYTSLLIFLENPIIGVGFGQQGFHAQTKYPAWVTAENYEFTEYYLNEEVRSFPPGFNMYTRWLAEIGIVGFGLFVVFLALLIYQCKKLTRTRSDLEKVTAIVLLVSFVGFAINWLQFDSFRVFGFWICLALLMHLLEKPAAHA